VCPTAPPPKPASKTATSSPPSTASRQDPNNLKNQVSAFAPGTKLNLDVLRDGKTEKLTVTTAERPGAKRTGKGGLESLSKNSQLRR
jgi:hypothetical protein